MGAPERQGSKDEEGRSLRTLIGFLFLAPALLAAGTTLKDCDDAPWKSLATALEAGDTRLITDWIGTGRVSLSVDGIVPGSYTSAQAGRLMSGFFRTTAERRVQYRTCGHTGSVSWADAVLRYRRLQGDVKTEEHLLLEFCTNGDGVRLCGIRSASPSVKGAS